MANIAFFSSLPKDYPATKTFEGVPDFNEFYRQWFAVDTPGQAIGLLYECKDIPPFGNLNDPTSEEKKAQEIEKWIDFYLDVAKNPNAKVASVAQQLLVKHWLQRLKPINMAHVGYLAATQKMLEFLAEPKTALYNPPYPRFVQQWLQELHQEWEHGGHPVWLEGDGPRNAMQHADGFTKAIVYPICAWGIAGILAKDDCKKYIAPYIETFLRDRNYNIAQSLLEIPCSEDPPTQIGFGQTFDINRIAAHAYIRIELKRTGRISVRFD